MTKMIFLEVYVEKILFCGRSLIQLTNNWTIP